MRTMTKVVFLVLLASFAAAHAESVDFTLTPEDGKSIVLPGELEKPVGEGPFPAIVMLHGCAGPWPLRDEMWSRRMVDWGYVVLRVDSFGPRGFPEGICERIQSVDPSARAEDAHAAKQYLQKLTFIDGSKIGVMGMSHGGWATLLAVQNSYLVDTVRPDPFKAAVALYPWCESRLYRLDAPLLVLIGELDDWTPSSRCERMSLKEPMNQEVTLKVYPDTTHDFDVPGIDKEVLGHILQYNPKAAEDAQARIKAYLAEHLR